MKDRVVNTNPKRYELVPSGANGVHGSPTYDVYFDSTPNVAGTPLKASVLFDDSLATQYGLNSAQSNYSAVDFPSPSNAFKNLLLYAYPVGTIYETVSPNFATVNAVQNYFGGTWAVWGAGTFAVGINGADTDFASINGTGGFKGIQQHTHTLNHGHTINGSGTLTSNSDGDGATSVEGLHTHTTPNHTHATGNASNYHNHGYAHTHSFSDTTSSNGSHDHEIFSLAGAGSSKVILTQATGYSGTWSGALVGSAGAHTHTISGTTTNQNDNFSDYEGQEHHHDISSSGGGTSSAGSSHQHTVPAHTHDIASHTHTITSAIFTTASNTSANGQTSAYTNGNLPPYTVCYKYVRTL